MSETNPTIENARWWQKGVVYQIYPRSFNDTTGNGIGDLQGIIDKLDYLNDGTPDSLGIDAIWISPFYPSPMMDGGYDISDYCDVDDLFGDLASFDRLVTEAHKRNIKVIIDYVPNHSSDQHQWFQESRSSRDNPKRDWYYWRDAKPDGSPPNNWYSIFGGPAWEWDELTEQYYFHQFCVEQPDLNWQNPDVRDALLDVIRFWMERGVDGLRMDVIWMLAKHPELPDQPEIEAPEGFWAEPGYMTQAHIYDSDQDDVHPMIHDMRKLLDEYGDTVGIGEIWLDWRRWVRYYGTHETPELQLPFNFGLIPLEWNAEIFREFIDMMNTLVHEIGWPNYVLGNHDQIRIASRTHSQEAARAAAMLLLTLRGTPTLYYGDEIGMEAGNIPVELMQDPQAEGVSPAISRDPSRTPMQWDSSAYAGFSTNLPWLPVSADYQTRNVEVMKDQPHSILNLYRRLIHYRKNSPALNIGSYTSLDSPEGTFVYLREYGNERCLIALNFTDETKLIRLIESGKLVISTFLDREEDVNELILRGNEGVIIEL